MQINHDRRRSFVDNIRTYNDWGDDFPRCEGYIAGSPPSFYMEERTLVWYYDFLWERCDHVYSFFTRQKFYQNNDLKLLGLAGSMKEAYEIVLKLVQMGYNSDCIYEMNDYLEKF